MRRQIARFVLRFALLYGALIGLAPCLPVYLWMERALVQAIGATLPHGDGALRRLSLDASGPGPAYRYEVERDGSRRSLGGPMHVHGFVPLLTLALILATPGVSRVRLAGFALAGGLAGSLLAAGMLMSDLRTWELAAFPGAGAAYPRAIALFDGLHRTAGGGLIPLVLWSFVAFSEFSAQRRAQT